MKQEMTTGQLLGACTTVLIAILTAWITLNNKVTRLESRQDTIDQRFDKIELKIDLLIDQTHNVRLELERKVNRQ